MMNNYYVVITGTYYNRIGNRNILRYFLSIFTGFYFIKLRNCLTLFKMFLDLY